MSRDIAHRGDAAVYAAAGLPTAVYVSKAKEASPTAQRLSYDSQIGTAVHQVLGEVVDLCQREGVVESSQRVAEVAHKRASGIPGRGDKAFLRISGLMSGYLRLWLPAAPAAFVGTEVAVANGRVDLAWRHPVHGFFYDEVKTWRHDRPDLDAETVAQVEKYLDAGISRHGEDFAGVRLLTLGNHSAALWFRSDGCIEPLSGSTLDLTHTGSTTDKEVAC